MKSLLSVHGYLHATWESAGHAVQIEILNHLAAGDGRGNFRVWPGG